MSIAETSIRPAPNVAALFPAIANDTLIGRLRDDYGMPAQKVEALDQAGLARTVAMLDFLSNNLPAASQEAWLGQVTG